MQQLLHLATIPYLFKKIGAGLLTASSTVFHVFPFGVKIHWSVDEITGLCRVQTDRHDRQATQVCCPNQGGKCTLKSAACPETCTLLRDLECNKKVSFCKNWALRWWFWEKCTFFFRSKSEGECTF